MVHILKKIVGSNILGKVTTNTEVVKTFDGAYGDALAEVIEKYIKPLGELTSQSVFDGYSRWETVTEYESGKFTGTKFILESEFEPDEELIHE